MSTSPQTSLTGDARLLDHLDALRQLAPEEGGVEHLPRAGGAAAPDGSTVVLDPEGVPVARLSPQPIEGGGDDLLTATVEWLSEASPLPFAHLRRWPSAPPRTVTVLEGFLPTPPPADVTDLNADDLVLTTVPLRTDDGGIDPRGADTLRRLSECSNARVLHVPAAGRDHSLRRRVLAALGAGSTHRTAKGGAQQPLPGAGVVLFTGLSGSGKSTLARHLRDQLVEASDHRVTLLDGDVVRHHLSKGLGFSAEDRQTNVRRIGWVATQIASHGGLTICSPIAPFEVDRQEIAAMCAENGVQFLLVHVATPLEECERRDRKGLYARARAGEIPDFTGISSPYETPAHPDLRVDTTGRTIEEVGTEVWDLLAAHGLTTADTPDKDAS